MGVEKVLAVIAWPAAFAVVVIALALIFRTPLTSLINRIRGFKIGEHSADIAAEGQKAAVEKQKDSTTPIPAPELASVTVPAAIAMPGPHPIYSHLEKPMLASITAANVPQHIERAWLVREIMTARLQRAHEAAYRLIFGSQINLLLAANTASQSDEAQARQIYEQAKAAYPDLYQDFPFDKWLAWPVNAALLTIENGRLKATPLAQEFLKYLVDNGLTSTKYG
jgi:hypothetical protein